jgi:hypothetical protein
VRDWRSTTAAVLILGLAIGANTAIFSRVNAALFRRQAFADPDRLVNIYQNDTAGGPLVVSSYSAYMEMAEYTDIFAATMAASIPNPARYLHDGAIRNAWSNTPRRPISTSWDCGRRSAAGLTGGRSGGAGSAHPARAVSIQLVSW